MSDELDDTTNAIAGDEEIDEEGVEEEKEIEDIDPGELPLDDVEELTEDGVVATPEEDPFGFGAFGELNEDGEFVAPTTDEDEEVEDEVSEDLF